MFPFCKLLLFIFYFIFIYLFFLLGKSPVEVWPEILGMFFLGELHIVYMDREGGGHVSLCMVNVTRTGLDLLAFILHFLNQFWAAARLVCSFCEAVSGSLSVASSSIIGKVLLW
jgi:hypothetical protein